MNWYKKWLHKYDVECHYCGVTSTPGHDAEFERRILLVLLGIAVIGLIALFWWVRLSQREPRSQPGIEHLMPFHPFRVYLGTDIDCQSEHAKVMLVKKFDMTTHCFATEPPIDIQDNNTLTITKHGEEWTLNMRTRTLERTFVPLKGGEDK